MLNQITVTLIGSCAALGFAVASAEAATIPYEQTFGGPVDFTTSVATANSSNVSDITATAPWTVTGGQYNNDIDLSANIGGNAHWATLTSSAAKSFTGVSGAPVTVSTQFDVNSFSFSSTNASRIGAQLGLGLSGSGNDFASGSYYRLVYLYHDGTQILTDSFDGTTTVADTGKLFLQEVGGDGQIASHSALALTPATGKTYTLTAELSYLSGTLTILGTLTDGINTITVSDTDTTPLTGDSFGYRNMVVRAAPTGQQTVEINADFDNFTIVPEPASLTLLGLASLLMLRRRT